jgi:hypothetical protein
MQFPIVENFYGGDMVLLGMDFDRNRPEREGALHLGPGTPQMLRNYLRIDQASRETSELSDLADMLRLKGGEVLIDGDMIPIEDLGIIKRALENNSVTITALGGDPGGGSVRQLLKLRGTRWLPYPPDTEELAQLVRGNPLRQQPASATIPPPPATTPIAQNDPELAEIEAILSQPITDLEIAPDSEEGVLRDSNTSNPPSESPSSSPPQAFMQSSGATSSPATEAPWFKDQVADLADLVQIIYAATASTQEGPENNNTGSLYTDALRLVQFTRTLGYLAAQPARGDTKLDLCELAEELLRSAGADTNAPRFLLRAPEPLLVRANKELLIQAMDAVLVLSKLCAGPEGTVRLAGERNGEGWACLELSFPSGPISSLTPDEIVTPYALRSSLPDMGRNALRAAARIISGQGGSLELSAGEEDSLVFTLTLPPA